jgi:hypothetical protein
VLAGGAGRRLSAGVQTASCSCTACLLDGTPNRCQDRVLVRVEFHLGALLCRRCHQLFGYVDVTTNARLAATASRALVMPEAVGDCNSPDGII